MQLVNYCYISNHYKYPNIAQLEERRTIVDISKADIITSLVRIQVRGNILPKSVNCYHSLMPISMDNQKQNDI